MVNFGGFFSSSNPLFSVAATRAEYGNEVVRPEDARKVRRSVYRLLESRIGQVVGRARQVADASRRGYIPPMRTIEEGGATNLPMYDPVALGLLLTALLSLDLVKRRLMILPRSRYLP